MEIIILGVLASALTQWLKKYSKNEWQTLAILGFVSIAIAGGYCALVVAGYWQTIATVLVTAGVVYTFIIQRFEK